MGRLVEGGVIRVGGILLRVVEGVDCALHGRSAAGELMIHY